MTPTVSHPLPAPTIPHPQGPGTQCRLSDLLARHRRGDAVYLTDHVLRHGPGHDPFLYTAHRGVLPGRAVGGRDWVADLVEYPPGQLPGGELIRSTGHWHPPTQLEIFQTLTGRILILTAWRTPTGAPVLTSQVCPAGTLAVTPFGGWHLTLVLDGPATVFNLYTDLPARPAPPPPASGGKYRRAALVELTAVRAGAGFTITGSPAGRAAWGTPQPIGEPAWLRDTIADMSLPSFIQHAADATLLDLINAAHRHVPTSGRPTDPR